VAGFRGRLDIDIEHTKKRKEKRTHRRKRSALRKPVPPEPCFPTKECLDGLDYGSMLGLLKNLYCAAFVSVVRADDRNRVALHMARVFSIYDDMRRSGPVWVYSLHLTKPRDCSDLKKARGLVLALPKFAAMSWVVFIQFGGKHGREHYHCLLFSRVRHVPDDLQTLAYEAVGGNTPRPRAGVNLRWAYRLTKKKDVRGKKIRKIWPDLCREGKREALEAALVYFSLQLFRTKGRRRILFLNCPDRPRGLKRPVLRLGQVLGFDPLKKRQ
tara:strand:+ start:2362 stop:3171 length:810 start_codon:yes stop_codon:yes gene_type:complete